MQRKRDYLFYPLNYSYSYSDIMRRFPIRIKFYDDCYTKLDNNNDEIQNTVMTQLVSDGYSQLLTSWVTTVWRLCWYTSHLIFVTIIRSYLLNIYFSVACKEYEYYLTQPVVDIVAMSAVSTNNNITESHRIVLAQFRRSMIWTTFRQGSLLPASTQPRTPQLQDQRSLLFYYWNCFGGNHVEENYHFATFF